ncbi:MAG: tRNA dihydrouridine(20/20a) synthase DusA [Xanthomonadaceae bacterium]|nr:tRNA dihydrouridine(20/20a) synthase DusA [Xanthomonadaceae bacterium]
MDITDRRLSVAPMMDWTDRHCRGFLRVLSGRALLHTEMVTATAVVRGDRARLLAFGPDEHPVVAQLGGSDPTELAVAARHVEAAGFDEVNLNCGCPSDRVQAGRFGACLMAEPALVAACVAAMRDAVSIPVTVKCRIGIDALDSWEHFIGFVDTVAAAGCDTFIVHARKAWLQGLSPKQNRAVPPLDYARVARLKAERPELSVTVNGGFTSVAQVVDALRTFDGVMLGRAAYHDPWLLAQLEEPVFGSPAPVASRHEAVRAFMPYIERALADGVPLNAVTRHMLGIFQGQPGARSWRRHLSEHAHLPRAGVETVVRALTLVPEQCDRDKVA